MKTSHNENSRQTMNTMELHQSYIRHLFLKSLQLTSYLMMKK